MRDGESEESRGRDRERDGESGKREREVGREIGGLGKEVEKRGEEMGKLIDIGESFTPIFYQSPTFYDHVFVIDRHCR